MIRTKRRFSPWVESACEKVPNVETKLTELWDAWHLWAELNGEHIGGKRNFLNSFLSAGHLWDRDPTGQQVVVGITLKDAQRSPLRIGATP